MAVNALVIVFICAAKVVKGAKSGFIKKFERKKFVKNLHDKYATDEL